MTTRTQALDPITLQVISAARRPRHRTPACVQGSAEQRGGGAFRPGFTGGQGGATTPPRSWTRAGGSSWANRAMLDQMVQADRVGGKATEPGDYRWRPFQLAFLLTVMVSAIRGAARPRHTWVSSRS